MTRVNFQANRYQDRGYQTFGHAQQWLPCVPLETRAQSAVLGQTALWLALPSKRNPNHGLSAYFARLTDCFAHPPRHHGARSLRGSHQAPTIRNCLGSPIPLLSWINHPLTKAALNRQSAVPRSTRM